MRVTLWMSPEPVGNKIFYSPTDLPLPGLENVFIYSNECQAWELYKEMILLQPSIRFSFDIFLFNISALVEKLLTFC